jgi:recombination protein RecT
MGTQQTPPQEARIVVPEGPKPTVRAILDKTLKQIISGLPASLKKDQRELLGDRIRRIITSISADQQFSKISPEVFAQTAIRVANIGLDPEPTMGQVYLVPFGSKLNIIIGYQGYLELMWRSGRIGPVRSEVVYPGEHFLYRNGAEFILEHEPAFEPPPPDEEPNWVYCVAEWTQGKRISGVVLPRWRVHLLKARSNAVRNAEEYNRTRRSGVPEKLTPWDTDRDAMYRKSSARQLRHYVPQSAELALASVLDDDASREEQKSLDATYSLMDERPVQVPVSTPAPAPAPAPVATAAKAQDQTPGQTGPGGGMPGQGPNPNNAPGEPGSDSKRPSTPDSDRAQANPAPPAASQANGNPAPAPSQANGKGLLQEQFSEEQWVRLCFCMRRARGWNAADVRRWLGSQSNGIPHAIAQAEEALLKLEQEEQQAEEEPR